MPKQAEADALVIFGITGDLAKKMTFQALYRLAANGTLKTPVIGVGRSEWTDDELREHARKSVKSTAKDFDEKAFKKLAKLLTYVRGDYSKPETYERLKEALGGAKRPVFYLEIPPSMFAMVVRQLGDAGLTKNARVVIEKPFGHDLKSAQELNRELHEVLDEEQIYRIDHFLGKEPVMDIIYLRFGNSVFEPIWNRRYVHSVQITMGEDFGVDDRGSFYDPVGALRDVVQNHLLQVLALTAMEPPAKGSELDPVRHAKLDLFKAIRSANPRRYVRGQYEGYRKVKGVDAKSQTETYVALRLEIENWRWWGVPFFLRAGKEMAAKATEVRVILKSPPPVGIGGDKPTPETDEIVVRIDPDPGAFFLLEAKSPGEDKLRRVHLDLLFEEQFGGQPGPYERLLCDALRGDQQHFSLQDTVEETWRIVEPLIEKPPPVVPYKRGSWGPKEADKLMRGMRGWREPWLPTKDK
jgi:glucose-6-phosphate 1-dehydrogenase